MYFILFLLIISLVYSTEPSNWADWDQYYNGDEGFIPWWGNDAGISYNEPGELNWYPAQDWEKEVCAADFTTDFYYKDQGVIPLKVDDRVYDLTIALNAELQDTQYTTENEELEYSFTIGWYIQGISRGDAEEDKIKYKILLKPGNDYVDLGDGETEKEFTIMTGTSGFYSNYTINNYTKAQIIIDGGSALEFGVVKLDLEGDPK